MLRGVELVTTSLMLLATFLLILLLGLNAILKRLAPRWRLSQADLLYLFVMLSISGSISGVGMMQFIVPMLSHIFRYATPENGLDRFLPFVPTWMVPQLSVIEAFYGGQASFFTSAHLRGWLTPMVTWSVFVFAFLGFMLCTNLLLRRQWIERERLTFPLVYFPLELTREGPGSLLRQRLLWVGFLIPVVLQSLASLNHLYPSIPYLPLKPSSALNLGRLLAGDPSSPFANVTLAFYPLALGIAYFVQLDVLFSCWFFYWFARLEEMACVLLGFRGGGAAPRLAEMPYLNQQSLGAFVALGAVALWLARPHLRQVFGGALRGDEAGDRREGDVSSRIAVLGLAGCGIFLLAFCRLSGIPLPLLGLFFLIYFLTVLGLTRIRAEAGLPWAFGPNHPPHIFLAWAVGPANIGPRALTALTYFQWFDWDYRGVTMPFQMEGLKLASAAGLRGRDMVKAILVASGLAIVVAYLALLAIYYHHGAESATVESYRAQWAEMPFGLLRTWADSQAGADWAETAGGAAGAAVVFLLAWLRTRWLWWPFHPVGYALSATFTPEWLWCPLFVVWLVKLLLLRYGGIRLYRRGIPFAVGLILGDYTVTALWAVAGLALGRTMYTTFPL